MHQCLQVRGLVIALQFPDGDLSTAGAPVKPLVGPLDLAVARGEILGLVGESGSGKTLTLRALAGIIPVGLTARDASGEYKPSCRTAIVFQDPMGFFNPRWRIRRSIAEVLRVVRRVPAAAVERRVNDLLESVGLSRHDGGLFPFAMSGGMIQRAAIAMALAVDPQVMLADEATSALDPETRDRILDLLCSAGRKRGVATVVVSHDLASLARVADRVIVLYDGEAVEEGPGAELLVRPRHRYTDLLVRSLPGPNTRGLRLPEIPPNPLGDTSRGCPFASRCPSVQDICTAENPPWTYLGEHRFRCHLPAAERDPAADRGPAAEHDPAADRGPAAERNEEPLRG